ncbi:MAG: hypothetical protein M3R16_08465, partial [Pseudomonadota bacterium]|nr:hypothetical protein [Pseudomonadota bacterium]
SMSARRAMRACVRHAVKSQDGVTMARIIEWSRQGAWRAKRASDRVFARHSRESGNPWTLRREELAPRAQDT